MSIRSIVVAGAALVTASSALAESADHYRGGWRSEAGTPQIYEFVIKGAKVGGIACTQCADGTTLARIEGTFGEAEGLDFTVRYLNLNGSLASEVHLRAKLEGGKLVVSGHPSSLVMIKDPRGPSPGPYPQVMLPPGSPPVPVVRASGGGGGGPPPSYVQPAPWRQLTAADIVGVWLGFGVGLDKQYFLIRKDGEQLFGLACGPCDNPYTMGALDNFAIHADTLEFDIEHEDWGEGSYVPFARHVTAHIAMNELRMDARRSDAPDRPGIIASLVGPIAIEATAGNVVGE